MHEASEAPASIAEVLPTPAEIEHARQHLITALSEDGIGLSKIQDHLENDITPALERHSKLPNYYGFVTGGTTPAAIYADHLAVDHDQNVGVHLPKETIATEVEDQALRMLCELFNLEPDQWMHRTFTTGATASNVMGLACGREFVLQHAANRARAREVSVADLGLPLAMCKAGIDEMQILSTVPHSSLGKAAALVGLGRSCIQDVSLSNQPHRFDMKKLEAALQKRNTACLVAISCSEINTGFFATNGEEMRQIRRLCDQYGAWLHVDAAFGLLARVLPRTEVYAVLNAGVAGLELADSITGDAHKLLNVPYDCGIFLSRHLATGTSVFQNTNAAYLSTSSTSTIPSPLNIGIENSRRFRALPVYATLAAYGREGYRRMLTNQITLARAIFTYLQKSEHYEALPAGNVLENVYIIVLFRAKDENFNARLVESIKADRRIYVSGTVWEGKPAARFAVASWMVQPEREIGTIKAVLERVASSAVAGD